jgi:hypothetical protein
MTAGARLAKRGAIVYWLAAALGERRAGLP